MERDGAREDNESGGGEKRTRSSATDNVTILSSTEDDDYRHKEICGRYIPCSRQPVTRQTTPNSGPSPAPSSPLLVRVLRRRFLSLVAGASSLDTGGEQQIGLHYRQPLHYEPTYGVTRPRARIGNPAFLHSFSKSPGVLRYYTIVSFELFSKLIRRRM